MGWVYEETPPNGGAPGDAFKSIFNGAGKGAAETLAREAIQNSVDAAKDPSASVRVEMRFARLTGEERRSFEAAASIEDMRPRVQKLGLYQSNALTEADGALNLLYIDDYETTGLMGDPKSPASNLRKLLMDLGGSDKAHTADGSGGSYGFGKAVYSSSSRIATIFAYSETTDDRGEPISLLMGCAYHEGHEFEGEFYTGRAWLGVGAKVKGKGTRYDPFQGDKARELAKKLGFERDDQAQGTSILIIDVDLTPEQVLSGIEDWWWPRIQSRLLEASVISFGGDELFPMPKRRKHLKPFIDAFDSAGGRTPDIRGKVQRKRFNSLYGKELGYLGAVVLDDSEEENPLGEDYESRLATVALVRGPLMVVDYYRNWYPSASAPLAVGCFLADQDMDFLLKLSEPPDHSRWDEGAGRLIKHDSSAPEFVRSILNRIKTHFRSFQSDAKPPAPPRPRQLAKLERDLASWFGIGGKGTPPPPSPSSAPIYVHPEGPFLSVEDGKLKAQGSVEIGLSEKVTEPKWFRVRLELHVAEEDGVPSSDPVPLSVRSESLLEEIGDGFLLGQALPGCPVRIDFESHQYDPDWTVRFMPEVLPVEEETEA